MDCALFVRRSAPAACTPAHRPARCGLTAARSPLRQPVVPPTRVGVRVRYTSAAGRQGEPAPGSEEQPLRDAVEQHEKEQKAEVDESKQPGYFHESRDELRKSGAVVREDVRAGAGSVPTSAPAGSGDKQQRPRRTRNDDPARAPESGTERDAASGTGHASGGEGGGQRQGDDPASAPESGTR